MFAYLQKTGAVAAPRSKGIRISAQVDRPRAFARASLLGRARGSLQSFPVTWFVIITFAWTWSIWLAMAFYGLFYALTNQVLKALIVESVDTGVRGRALGIYSFCISMTTLLSSVITGALWKVYGPAVPFYFSAGIATVSALALLAHRSPKRN